MAFGIQNKSLHVRLFNEMHDLTFHDNAELLCEFLQFVVYEILYQRRIYPPILFEARRKYGATVHIPRSNLLMDYIQKFTMALLNDLSQGLITNVNVHIFMQTENEPLNEDATPIEEFLVEIICFLTEEEIKDNVRVENQANIGDIEAYFRGCLTTLTNIVLSQIPALGDEKEYTFRLSVQMKESYQPSGRFGQVEEEVVWVPMGGQNVFHRVIDPHHHGKEKNMHIKKQIYPLRSFNTGFFNVQLLLKR